MYRLGRILAPHARLAPSATDRAAIQTALTAQQARLALAADTIVRALRAHPDLS